MDFAAAESFKAAETVPGVKPRCCAMVFSVTFPSLALPAFFLCAAGVKPSSNVHSQKFLRVFSSVEHASHHRLVRRTGTGESLRLNFSLQAFHRDASLKLTSTVGCK